jgi:hypothetical protein
MAQRRKGLMGLGPWQVAKHGVFENFHFAATIITNKFVSTKKYK